MGISIKIGVTQFEMKEAERYQKMGVLNLSVAGVVETNAERKKKKKEFGFAIEGGEKRNGDLVKRGGFVNLRKFVVVKKNIN